MIIQCDSCQTRFRIADEKVKPGGSKVRCSRCKEIFTIFPPPPEPADDTVDFGAFNMEKVTEDAPAEESQVDTGHGTDQEAPPAETYGIVALDIQTGKPIWQRKVSAGPVAWGLAIDRQGHVLATLQDGRVLCLGPGT